MLLTLPAEDQAEAAEAQQDQGGRLRRVRVVCGDFMRVLGGDWQDKRWRDVGIFFDPPYGDPDRDTGLYHHDGLDIAPRVEAWCLERGQRKNHRIVVAGYDTEYKSLIDDGWRAENWKANGGYSNRGGKSKNRHRETLFISPHCFSVGMKQNELF